MVTQTELRLVDASRYNWPWPAPKHRCTFAEGDTVRIARLKDEGITTESIIGHWGRVIEVDYECAPFLWLLEFQCYVCQGIHTMDEEEMDLVYSPGLTLLEDKAGILPELPDPVRVEKREFNDLLAFYLHEVGFKYISVKDHMGLQLCQPKPKWRKISRMTVVRLTELNQVLALLMQAARRAGGKVEEFETASPTGFVAVREEDLDVLTLEMPLQVIFRSCD